MFLLTCTDIGLWGYTACGASWLMFFDEISVRVAFGRLVRKNANATARVAATFIDLYSLCGVCARTVRAPCQAGLSPTSMTAGRGRYACGDVAQ